MLAKSLTSIPCSSDVLIKEKHIKTFYSIISLYLKNELFRFGKIDLPLCCFCKMINETPLHIFFFSFRKTKLLWYQLKELVSNKPLSIPSLTLS